MGSMTDEERAFLDLLYVLRQAKPDDRSDRDRYFAILLTDLEKAYAFFMHYIDGRE